jgi:3-deoxy-7-phosphoheptulonate synthase
MVIVMEHSATDGDIDAVAERVRANGGEAFVSRGTVHTIIGLVGDTERFKAIDWRQMAGVDHVIQIGKPYKMVSRDLHPETTVVKIGTVPIGRDSFTIIAGPCAVENEEQTMTSVKAAKDAGATVMRGDEGIEILQEARRRFGLPFVVEVVDVSQVAHVADVADCIRIGTRNAQNFELLKEVGLTNKPVMLKRGLAMTIEEWLQAAEYIAQRGNSEVILCERGIRTFEPSTRNTLDLGGMAVAQQESHLPVMVDPSHAVGKHSLVAPMACAAIAAGADAVMVDIHPRPEDALVDGAQALLPEEVVALGKQLQAIADALGRPVNR